MQYSLFSAISRPSRGGRKHRALVTLLLSIMLGIVFSQFFKVFHAGRSVQIDDRDQVLGWMNTRAPVAMTLEDDSWGILRLTDSADLFPIIQLLHKLPKAENMVPAGDTGYVSGHFLYADGTVKAFSISDAFVLEGDTYYHKDIREELAAVREQLQRMVYTVSRLSNFFRSNYNVTLSNGTQMVLLELEEAGQFQSAIRSGVEVEALDEAVQTVDDRNPHYTIQVADSAGTELIRLSVYANQSTIVSDIRSGQENVLCFSSSLDTLCQQILELHNETDIPIRSG